MTTDPTIAAIHGMAYALLRLRNVGGELSRVQRRYQDATRALPRHGDLVIELSTLARAGADEGADRARYGTFIRDAWESHEGWERPEHVFYIQRVDTGEVVRWTNANFMRIPASVADAETFFDLPCVCGEVAAISAGTAITASGRHAVAGCELSAPTDIAARTT